MDKVSFLIAYAGAALRFLYAVKPARGDVQETYISTFNNRLVGKVLVRA